MSEDPMDLEDTGRAGERRRALRAERDRQSQRDRPDAPPPPPALVRPYAAPQDSALLLADAPATPAEGVPDEERRSAETQPLAERPPDPSPEPSPEPSQESVDDAPPPLPVRVRGAEFPPDAQAPLGAAPAPEAEEWSAFTPVIAPEPMRFDDHAPAAWERPGPWTTPSTPPSGSWMDVGEQPAPEPGTAPPPPEPWTADDLGDDEWLRHLRGDEAEATPTPPPGLPAEDADPVADGVQEEPAADEDVKPLTPPAGWARDLSKVDLFRSALEEAERTPPGIPPAGEDEPSGGFSLFEPPPRPPEPEPLEVGSFDEEPVDVESLDDEPLEAPELDPVDVEPLDDEPLEAPEPDPVEVPPVDVEPVDVEPVEDQPVEDQPVEDQPVDVAPVADDDTDDDPDDDPDKDADDADDADDESDDEPDDEPEPGPVLDRPSFGRAPSQRLSEVVLQDEDRADPDEEEPVRGTLAPVLRRSTERARYPTSTTPVIRPPVLPPSPPGDGAPASVPPARPLTWEQALAGDVLPGKKRRPEGVRRSKPRHESGGPGEEYKPVKPPPDRSLTLLVVAMLLVLVGLVVTAAVVFWPRIHGSADADGPAAPIAAPRTVGGP